MILEIPAGTVVLSPENTPQYENYNPYYHTVDPDVVGTLAGTPAPPEGTTIVRAYQMGPNGISFKYHDATLAANYKAGDAPQGKTIVWAFYDEDAQSWTELETAGYVAAGNVVPNSAACRTGHFTYFALIAK